MELSRRSFLFGAGAAGTAAVAAMAGFSPVTKAVADEAAEDAEASEYVVEDFDADETLDCDIVVVGSGMSGTAATAQAIDSGASVVVFEAHTVAGGNGQFTEVIAGVDSDMSKELGVEVDPYEIIRNEINFFNYRVDGLFWMDAISNSGDNINWLADHGALFEGVVDDDRGSGVVPTAHWFKDRIAANATEPLMNGAIEQGAQLLLETRATKLIMKDGAVVGVVGEKSDGSTVRANCKAVVLASGGYAANYDLMIERGCPPVYYGKSLETNRGDGLLMATAAGGVSRAANSAMLFSVTIPVLGFLDAFFLQRFGQSVIVNGSGERFSDENCGNVSIGCFLNMMSLEDRNFMVFTPNVLDFMSEQQEGLGDTIRAACGDEDATTQEKEHATGGDAVQDSTLGTRFGNDDTEVFAFKGATVQELAEAMEVDPAKLEDTLKRYNEFCDGKQDLDFGKDPEKLMKLDEEGPFYALRVYPGYATSIGGIKTNRSCQVTNMYNEPITGLYAVGCDGNMMYCETYTIDTPGSCNMGNVNSGRTAVKHIAETLL